MSTIQAKLHTNRKLSDGTHSVKLYINGDIVDGGPVWFPLDLKSYPNQWDVQKGRFRKNATNYKDKNRVIAQKELEADSIYRQFAMNGERFDVEEFKLRMGKQSKRTTLTVIEFYDQLINNLQEQSKTDFSKANSAKVWRETRNLLVRFLDSEKKSHKIRFKDVNARFLHELENYCRRRGNNDNTIRNRFSNIRRAWNLAKKQGYAEPRHYPFGDGGYEFGRQIKPVADNPNPLSLEQIEMWKQLEVEDELDWTQKITMASYYLYGSNLIDLALLEKSKHIRGDRTVFNRSKTGCLVSVKNTEHILRLYDYFWQSDSKYVFPILNETHVTGSQVNYRVARKNKHINKNIELLAPMVGKDPTDFTYYNFRDTFASILLQKGINVRLIQKMLGHKSLAYTMRYLDSFGVSELDDVACVL